MTTWGGIRDLPKLPDLSYVRVEKQAAKLNTFAGMDLNLDNQCTITACCKKPLASHNLVTRTPYSNLWDLLALSMTFDCNTEGWAQWYTENTRALLLKDWVEQP